jgi:hypothetical protein
MLHLEIYTTFFAMCIIDVVICGCPGVRFLYSTHVVSERLFMFLVSRMSCKAYCTVVDKARERRETRTRYRMTTKVNVLY